ncbi:DNA internalization-related competence protein ComEC/Rec2 [Aeromonas hydrophila]|uniref:DNA internalization-related competence protein ComEC/Rec2 n=1 Tax=Aeromonas hydrophila TaxID=644 RepID=UPI001A31B612|nr:DNA internalization-related competence protein ComEC/Rec2 [Aeromonas hydrophila]HAT2384756.1 DNA internalization-related competence protein ComEC/Rec2 [Aeromonas hydrophila]HAT2416975.1 DNA internalization-related competence protein ComEC/Rec2 [Aeromonas hydrophila]HAT2527829.1 DNA internalization-related competence protein ComEC/Rec2 [Aeromonas hydrophila]HAT2547810.1 DNA internalization-related competence protein ComEC/Rec2 [Aeromonas hydrophila]
MLVFLECRRIRQPALYESFGHIETLLNTCTMDLRLLSFALGASSSQLWPWLPSWEWGGLMLLLAFPLAGYRCWRLLFLLCGILWMQGSLHYRLAWLDQLGKKTSHIITAQLQSAEPEGDKFIRLVLRVNRLDEQALTPAPLVRINAYQALPAMTAGSRLTLVVSLKPVHGLANEAGMDGRRLLLGKGITATGNLRRVIQIEPAQTGLRERWLARAAASWQDLSQGPLLAALTFGEQGGITDEQWRLFRGSGLTHIIAISGQHIALVAVLGWWLGRLFGLRGAILVALLFAALYSWLAGFAVATERALIMVLVWSLLRWRRREWPAHRIWLWAFVVLTLWDPFALYSAGFWLSFLAVALLLVASLLEAKPGLIRLQGLLLLGLLPLQLALFEGIAPLSLLLNLLALPLFCIGIIPLALIGVLLAPLSGELAHLLFWLADVGLQWVLWALARLASQWQLWWPVPGWVLPLTALLTLLWCAWHVPGGRPLLLPGGVALLLAAWPAPTHWQLRVLDVGQGLAVLITRGERGILFDTGDRYPGGYNMADAVILPLLNRLDVRVLDYLVISHKDRDHAGNRRAILQALPVRHELSSFDFGRFTTLCRRGQQWRWQGLEMAVLWPQQPGPGHNNDGCVLQIRDGARRILLSADIERQAEQRLLALEGEGLASTLLVSPHHGSRTSSTAPFVAAVAPRYVVHSAGFMNQWGFPRPEVVARYQEAQQWVTGLDGEILVEPALGGLRVRAEREQGPWFRRHGDWWRPALWPAR